MAIPIHPIIPQDEVVQNTTFSDLPRDVVLQIFSEVLQKRHQDFNNIQLVCHNFRDLANDHQIQQQFVQQFVRLLFMKDVSLREKIEATMDDFQDMCGRGF